MPHLLSVWHSVVERFNQAGRTLLLLDYDGTLAPIVSRPEHAHLPPDTMALINDLKDNTKFVLGVISGRSLADVRNRVRVPNIIYAGNHGLEIEGIGEQFLHPGALVQLDVLDRIYQELNHEFNQYAGVIIENKGLTLSVHYRLTPEHLVSKVEDSFNSVLSPNVADEAVKITHGKKVFEVRPNVGWDKGKAITKIMEIYFDASLAMYFGDDFTDEDGFRVVQDAGGIAVFVGPAREPTRALFRLDSPVEVAETLRLLRDL